MADDPESFIPGPLDDLVPGLRTKRERFPALPVHPRVVHARAPNGELSIVLASFAPAAGVRALHAGLKRMVEAALLAWLSRPADELAEDEGELAAVELYAFAAQPFDVGPALSPFALGAAPLDDPAAHAACALLRREAQRLETPVREEPLARYRAPALRSRHALALPLERALRERAPEGAWGSEPGVLARVCVDALEQLGYPGVAPTRQGIERLEAVLVHRTPDCIRWLTPLAYQALCDLVAVAATATYGREVEWGVCEPDEETKLAPPPLIRVAGKRESFHVPLGEHVLRWCIMPSAPSEQIPSLGSWTEHEFSGES